MPKVEPGAIDRALEATGGKVKRVETPFPGSALYVPSEGGPHPGIVTLHGSEGGSAGFSDLQAIEWAKEGFAVLAYDYYGGPGTPKQLANVDISKTMEAVEWLRTSPHSQGQKVGLYGGSRGAEQALLIASLLEDSELVSAVGAHAPHATVVGSFDPETWSSVRDPIGRPLPAWRVRSAGIEPGRPVEIEKYEGPVFISHGTRDELWDVRETRTLEARMRAAAKDNAEVHYLPGQGHNPTGEARARNETATLDFFRRALR